MSSPIIDKAEVSIDFPDKFFMGSFSRNSRYDVSADEEGIHLHFDRELDEKRHVGVHLHYYLLADIISSTAEAIKNVEDLSPDKKKALKDAAKILAKI